MVMVHFFVVFVEALAYANGSAREDFVALIGAWAWSTARIPTEWL